MGFKIGHVLKGFEQKKQIDAIIEDAKAQQKKESIFQQWAGILLPIAASFILPGIGGLLAGGAKAYKGVKGLATLSKLITAADKAVKAKGLLGSAIKGIGTGVGTYAFGKSGESLGRKAGLGGDPTKIAIPENYYGGVKHAASKIREDLGSQMEGMDWGTTSLYSGLLAGAGNYDKLQELGKGAYDWGVSKFGGTVPGGVGINPTSPSLNLKYAPNVPPTHSIKDAMVLNPRTPSFQMPKLGGTSGSVGFNPSGTSIVNNLTSGQAPHDWRVSGLNPLQSQEEQEFQEYLNQLFGGNQ